MTNFLLTGSTTDTAAADGQPKYWVLPLSNFGPEFHFSHPTLDSHPLRIYPTPSIPEGLNTKDAVLAAIRANEQNKLIIFDFNGSLGFIEPLPDCKERVEQLKSGRCVCVVTAVMAAEIPNGSDLEKLEAWLPFDLLFLLGLAAGNEIGAAWIELRSESGALIRRIHVKAGLGAFTKSRAAISQGIGVLLTQSRTSQHFGTDYLRIAKECDSSWPV